MPLYESGERGKIFLMPSAIATWGSWGPVPPLTTLCAPILVYSEYVFGTLRNDKTTDNNDKRNKNVQT